MSRYDPGDEAAEEARRVVVRREGLLHRPGGRVGVEALVHPRVLELVVADDAVPELVAALVDGHALGRRDLAGSEPPRAGREQRRVLHAARAALPGGIDDRDVAVRVGAEPGAVVAQRGARGIEVAIGLRRVLGLQEQPHLDRRQRRRARSAPSARRSRGSSSRRSRARPPGSSGASSSRRCRGVSRSTPVAPTTQSVGTVR